MVIVYTWLPGTLLACSSVFSFDRCQEYLLGAFRMHVPCERVDTHIFPETLYPGVKL